MRTVHPPYTRRQGQGDPFGSLETGDVNPGVGTSGAKNMKHEHTHTRNCSDLTDRIESLTFFFWGGGVSVYN